MIEQFFMQLLAARIASCRAIDLSVVEDCWKQANDIAGWASEVLYGLGTTGESLGSASAAIDAMSDPTGEGPPE